MNAVRSNHFLDQLFKESVPVVQLIKEGNFRQRMFVAIIQYHLRRRRERMQHRGREIITKMYIECFRCTALLDLQGVRLRTIGDKIAFFANPARVPIHCA